jgi:phosphoribosylanthranilate isomerase
MKVKICGITSLEDAIMAVDAGADMLGFNFYPKSPRYIEPAACARLVERLMGHCNCSPQLVGVFVNSGLIEIVSTLNQCGLDLAQLSGDEPPELVNVLGERAFKGLRPADSAALEAALQQLLVRHQPPALLIDAYHPNAYGGTGKKADWSLARGLARLRPILLAGGLTPENVADAIKQVTPWGVDVASGVELSPGKKDPARVAAFIKAAKAKYKASPPHEKEKEK